MRPVASSGDRGISIQYWPVLPTAPGTGQGRRPHIKLRRKQPGVTHVGHRRTGDTATGIRRIPFKFLVVMLRRQPRPDGRKHEEPLAEDLCAGSIWNRDRTETMWNISVSAHIVPPFRVATPQRSLPKRKVGCIWGRECTNEYQRSLLSLPLCGFFLFFQTAQCHACTARLLYDIAVASVIYKHELECLVAWTAYFIRVMSTASPLRKQRLAALAFCAAWNIISGSIGLNALIKFVPYCAFRS